MVRASTNEPPASDVKKETTKKKSAARKKTVVTGIWPCKINGCNKQFAREADLKRHQRTTKLHSMPSFACPQCDATFTRTDALRRHQKSRHNGVIIEPPDHESKDEADEDGGSSGSQTKSRSATPSSKGKERVAVPHTQSHIQENRSGPSSYYRQHTATSTTTPYISRPLPMDPQYAQIGLPTSATRLNVATNWPYPHPWPDGTAPQMSYQQIYYSPHYRPNGSVNPSPIEADPDQQNIHGVSAARTQPISTSPPGSLQLTPNNTHQSNEVIDPTRNGHSLSAPTVDPSLSSSDSTELTNEQVLEITQAAMKAVLEAEAERSNAESRAGSTSTPSFSERGDREETGKENGLHHKITEDSNMHGYGPPLDRPEPMEHMLTEDGEPMLNPAELLTQESLASPPPS